MQILAPTAAALLLAGAAQAQTAPQSPPERSASDLTRDLNSRPPTIEEYLARPPAASTSAPAPAASAPAPARPEARPAPVLPAAPPSRIEPASRTAPTPAPVTAPVPEAAEPAPAAAPPPPAVTVLDAPARAALPFSVELPAGFQIVTGRPGPDFRIYTIRRGERSFVMVYAGPASQFPIYTGQMVEAGGRASVVVDESGARHAVEHLFQRPEGTSPREIHVWTMTLDGADRALAEQIAQSVDVR